jgi:hypothetical protein
MAGRGNPLHTDFDAPPRWRVARRSSARTRRDAVRRGAILGSVFAGHLLVLMLVLHPSWRRIEPVRRLQEADVLRLTFDPAPKIPRSLSVGAVARMPAKVKPVPSAVAPPKAPTAVVMHSTNIPPSTATALIVAVSPTDDLRRGYEPGNFQAALQNAQRTKADQVPGVATPLIGGIQLQARPNIKGAVHAVTEYIRCTDKQLEMENGRDQFSTPQLMDRALQLDGCGPHSEHPEADAAVDEIAHRVIFSH